MENPTSFTISRKLSRAILYFVLFSSGLSALIYQIVWIRKFGLVFGVHVFSMSTVLTAFMAGLALGSLYFGRKSDKFKNPVRLFFLLEFGIGLFALLFPYSFKGLTYLYAWIANHTDTSAYTLQLIRFTLSFIFLLIPTTLMGGTLPVILRIFVSDLRNLGRNVSHLYSLNNFGAFVGCLLAGFVTIRTIGLYPSSYLAAAINLVNAGFVYLLATRGNYRITEERPSRTNDTGVQQVSPFMLKLVLWVFAIEGFTTLAYEVIWARILIDFSIDKTTYFSSVIIASFIFGLSIGSLVISKWIDKIRDLLRTLIYIEVFIGMLSVLLLFVFVTAAPHFIAERSMTASWIASAGKEYLFFFLLLSPPAFLMGITYPLASKLAADNMEKLGKRMGLMGFLDTAGSIVGSFIAGFIMIPFIGTLHSFLVTVAINLILGGLILAYHPDVRKQVKIAGVFFLLFFFLLILWRMPDGKYIRTWWDNMKNITWWETNTYESIAFFDESAAGTVTVRVYPHGLALNINGHNTAYDTQKDMKVNRQLGFMPYLLHPHPKTALVIGFGTGATARSLIQPDIERVDLAEITSGVIRAGKVFNHVNRNVLAEPKLKVFDDDGRSVVFMAREKYDIITSNAIHPRLSNNIYTKDFYDLCRDKLNDDGIMCQWMPQNWMNETEYKAMLKAFTEAFPYSTLWYVNEYSTHAIGSKTPFKIDAQRIAQHFEKNPELRRDFRQVGIENPLQFMAQYWWNMDVLNEYLKDAEVNTDNHPVVEFSRVINIAPVANVMDELIRHPIRYDDMVINLPDSTRDLDLKKMQDYSNAEKAHMDAILRNVRAVEKGTL